jgi:septal ring factor EnvC (AmiA/AmiB activator)
VIEALLRLSRASLPPLQAGPAAEARRRQALMLLAAAASAAVGTATQAAPSSVSASARPTVATTGDALEPSLASVPFHLQPPVAGRLAGRFGDALPNGIVRKGVVLSAMAGEPVRAPAGGQIAFAGPFRGYGLLLILNHGDGYHTVLSGIGHLAGGIGRRVDAGETIGRVADPETGPPILSLELWRHRQPIDPLPWLGIIEAKENG